MPSALPYNVGDSLGGTAAAAAAAFPKNRDLLTGTDLDLVIQGGDLVMVGGGDSIVQDCAAILKFVLGEWFLDTSLGIDYFGKVFQKGTTLAQIRAIFRAALLSVLGVVEVLSLEASYSNTDRSLTISFTVQTDLGELDGSTSVAG